MPGVGPAPLMPPAVFAVSWLKAVSLRLSFPYRTLLTTTPLQVLERQRSRTGAGGTQQPGVGTAGRELHHAARPAQRYQFRRVYRLARTTDRFGRQGAKLSPAGRQQRDGVLVRRPYAGLLSPACTSPAPLSFNTCNGVVVNNVLYGNDNLNDTAFNQDTANTAGGINGAGPTPASASILSTDRGWRGSRWVSAQFCDPRGKELQFQAQAFNLFNHANYYVQNGDGINQLQYNPIGATAATACPPTAMLSRTQFGPRQFRKPMEKSAPTVFPAFCSFPQDSRSSAFH